MAKSYTTEEKEAAIAICTLAGQDPYSYIDYSDLRSGKQNWEYFLPSVREAANE